MGDNVANQPPISAKGKLNAIQLHDGAEDLKACSNLYATENCGIHATIFIGDGGGLSNISASGTGIPGAPTNSIQYNAGSGNFGGVNGIVIDSTNARVGIGTTNPTANLHVNGTVTFESLPINGTVPSNVLHYDVATGEVNHGYMELITTKVKAGEALSKGEAVYVSGSTGDFPVVSLADASDSTKMPSIGLVLEDSLALNDEGHVVTFGEYPAGAFTTFQEGDTLYVSNVTPGGLINTSPCSSVGPDLIQNVGVFIQDTAGSGDKILVTGVGRANDVPNSNVLSDESTVNYVYVATGDKDLKRIDPSLLTTNKTFVIDHPKDKNRFLVHGCLEGPEAGVYYRGKGEIIQDICEIQLPDYVSLLLIRDLEPTIHVTPLYVNEPLAVSEYSFDRNSFKVYGQPCKFNWTFQGARSRFKTEPFKSEVEVKGNGPYKWI